MAQLFGAIPRSHLHLQLLYPVSELFVAHVRSRHGARLFCYWLQHAQSAAALRWILVTLPDHYEIDQWWLVVQLHSCGVR